MKQKQAPGGGFYRFGLIAASGEQFRLRPPTRCLARKFSIRQYLSETHQFTDIKAAAPKLLFFFFFAHYVEVEKC